MKKNLVRMAKEILRLFILTCTSLKQNPSCSLIVRS